jgi:hypothetical protein
MRLSIKLSPGSRFSQSAKRLAQALSVKLGYKVRRHTENKPKRKQLEYGLGVDKITQYKYFQDNGINSLEFTTDHNVAKQWVRDGSTVFGRRLLNASCGKGIVVILPEASEDDLDSCPSCSVYTRYKKKKREFRVHIYRDKVVAIVEKKLRKDWEGGRCPLIRNLANGYVFTQTVTDLPEGIKELAIKAAQVSPSHFRGVDIGYNEKKNDLFVIEVNSAPGIEGSNINAYVNAITS